MSKNLAAVGKDTDLAPRSFENVLESFFADPWGFFRQPEMATFRIDLKEDDKTYTVEAEMPGVKREDITLDLEDGELTIGVAAREKADEAGKKLVRNERRYSYMERSVYLADAAEDGVDAKLENGELIITVPKRLAESRKKKIEIK